MVPSCLEGSILLNLWGWARQTDETLQGVLSGHGQVETRVADISLHPVNRLAGSRAEQIGIEQLDDICNTRWDISKQIDFFLFFFIGWLGFNNVS